MQIGANSILRTVQVAFTIPAGVVLFPRLLHCPGSSVVISCTTRYAYMTKDVNLKAEGTNLMYNSPVRRACLLPKAEQGVVCIHFFPNLDCHCLLRTQEVGISQASCSLRIVGKSTRDLTCLFRVRLEPGNQVENHANHAICEQLQTAESLCCR
jgi:hypothetical protein